MITTIKKWKIRELVAKAKREEMISDYISNFFTSEDETIDEAIRTFEEIISEHMPSNAKGFTGGYCQRLSDSNSIYLFYGNDSNKNKITVTLAIDKEEYSYFKTIFDIYMDNFQEVNRPQRKKLTRKKD